MSSPHPHPRAHHCWDSISLCGQLPSRIPINKGKPLGQSLGAWRTSRSKLWTVYWWKVCSGQFVIHNSKGYLLYQAAFLYIENNSIPLPAATPCAPPSPTTGQFRKTSQPSLLLFLLGFPNKEQICSVSFRSAEMLRPVKKGRREGWEMVSRKWDGRDSENLLGLNWSLQREVLMRLKLTFSGGSPAPFCCPWANGLSLTLSPYFPVVVIKTPSREAVSGP